MKVKWHLPFGELTLTVLTTLYVTTRGQSGTNNRSGQDGTTNITGQVVPLDSGDGDPSCADKFDICPFIVKQSKHDCEDDPYFVMKYCNKSCGFCTPPRGAVDNIIEGNLARDLDNHQEGRLVGAGLFASLMGIVACCDICIFWLKRRAKRRRRKRAQRAKMIAEEKQAIRDAERLEHKKATMAEFERVEVKRLEQERLQQQRLEQERLQQQMLEMEAAKNKGGLRGK